MLCLCLHGLCCIYSFQRFWDANGQFTLAKQTNETNETNETRKTMIKLSYGGLKNLSRGDVLEKWRHQRSMNEITCQFDVVKTAVVTC